MLANFGVFRQIGGRTMILNLNIFYSTQNVEVPANVPEPRISSSQLAQFRKGPGGRASFSGNVVTIFGNSGFTGRSLVNRLAKKGCQLILPYRGDSYFVKEHKVVGELGQILYFPFQLKDEESIRKAVKYSNIVINLVGTRISTKNYPMHETHVEGARRLARISREMGVDRFIHLSAMGADPDYQPKFYKKSQFLKTKGLGELAVRDEFPNATIIRPSIMYGEYDKFIYPMLTRFRKNPLDWVWLYKSGTESFKMPVFSGDVVAGIAQAALDPTAAGRTFEFVGPYCYQMSELVDYMFGKAQCFPVFNFNYKRTSYRDPWFIGGRFICWANEKVYKRNDMHVNYDWIEFSEVNNDVLSDDVLSFADLGITRLTEFENVGGMHCHSQSFVRAYELRYGDVDDPPLPLRSPPLRKQKPPQFTLDQIPTEKKPFGLHFFNRNA